MVESYTPCECPAAAQPRRPVTRVNWLAITTLSLVLFAPAAGCAFLAGAAVGGAGGYVAGHEAGEDEGREEARTGEED